MCLKQIQLNSVQRFLESEKGFVDKYDTYIKFYERIRSEKNNALKKFKSLKGSSVGYGAPAKATTILNYYGIKLPYTIEDNAAKQGKYIPGVKTKIISKHEMESIPDNIIVLAWNFFEEIKANNTDLLNKGVNFVTLK